MSLKERLKTAHQLATDRHELFSRYGIVDNPFPSAAHSSGNPHLPSEIDDDIESRIASFIQNNQSQVVVVEGSQGVGKTNLLNYYEQEITEAISDKYYVIRYLADPEVSFDGILRRLFQEFGEQHLVKLGEALSQHPAKEEVIEKARSHEMRVALQRLARFDKSNDSNNAELMLDWLLGSRVLNRHKEALGVHFRLDTVESKTLALRDLVICSSAVGLLSGIFLLLDELEKQGGVLGPTLVVRYLSAIRAIIDALPNHLFMMIAITPDAMRRYSLALPALRSRLQDRVTLQPLTEVDQAVKLATFYLEQAERRAERQEGRKRPGTSRQIVSEQKCKAIFMHELEEAEKRRDLGVRQREYLHALHKEADKAIQQAQ